MDILLRSFLCCHLIKYARRILIQVIAITLTINIFGCGNALVRIPDPEWKEINVLPLPDNDRTEFHMSSLSPGLGAIVAKNNLVKIRVTTHKQNRISIIRTEKPIESWVWTGWAEEDDKGLWGEYGSTIARKSLIGRLVGEKIVWEVRKGSEEIEIPQYAVSLSSLYNQYVTGLGIGKNANVYVAVGPEAIQHDKTWSDVEILATCPATLYRRMGKMTQVGAMVNMFEMNYKGSREGTLRWSLLEGKCGQPEGTINFMVGPMYYLQGREQNMLYNWTYDYFDKWPPKRYPEKYEYFSTRDKKYNN